MKTRILYLISVAALLVGSASALAEVIVSDAWVRGTVKGQTETGAFMTIRSTEPTKLLQAASPVAKSVEVHEMTMSGGMMTMRPVKALAIPANSPVELKPGSYHVMLIGLQGPLTKGQLVPLQLTFSTSGGASSTVDVQAMVHDLTEAYPPMKMDGMNKAK